MRNSLPKKLLYILIFHSNYTCAIDSSYPFNTYRRNYIFSERSTLNLNKFPFKNLKRNSLKNFTDEEKKSPGKREKGNILQKKNLKRKNAVARFFGFFMMKKSTILTGVAVVGGIALARKFIFSPSPAESFSEILENFSQSQVAEKEQELNLYQQEMLHLQNDFTHYQAQQEEVITQIEHKKTELDHAHEDFQILYQRFHPSEKFIKTFLNSKKDIFELSALFRSKKQLLIKKIEERTANIIEIEEYKTKISADEAAISQLTERQENLKNQSDEALKNARIALKNIEEEINSKSQTEEKYRQKIEDLNKILNSEGNSQTTQIAKKTLLINVRSLLGFSEPIPSISLLEEHIKQYEAKETFYTLRIQQQQEKLQELEKKLEEMQPPEKANKTPSPSSSPSLMRPLKDSMNALKKHIRSSPPASPSRELEGSSLRSVHPNFEIFKKQKEEIIKEVLEMQQAIYSTIVCRLNTLIATQQIKNYHAYQHQLKEGEQTLQSIEEKNKINKKELSHKQELEKSDAIDIPQMEHSCFLTEKALHEVEGLLSQVTQKLLESSSSLLSSANEPTTSTAEKFPIPFTETQLIELTEEVKEKEKIYQTSQEELLQLETDFKMNEEKMGGIQRTLAEYQAAERKMQESIFSLKNRRGTK